MRLERNKRVTNDLNRFLTQVSLNPTLSLTCLLLTNVSSEFKSNPFFNMSFVDQCFK